MREERRAYNIFRKALFGGWLLLTVATLFASTFSQEFWKPALFFFILASIYEAVPIHLTEQGEISLTFLVVWAAMLVCPPFHVMAIPFAVVLFVYGSKWLFARLHWNYESNPDNSTGWKSAIQRAFLGTVSRKLAHDWVDRHNYPVRHVFSLLMMNGSSMAICAGAAALVYAAVGGMPIKSGGVVDVSLMQTLLPMVVAVAVYFVIDITVFSATCVFWENRPEYVHSWRSWYPPMENAYFRHCLPNGYKICVSSHICNYLGLDICKQRSAICGCSCFACLFYWSFNETD